MRCEVCGRKIREEPRRVVIEGAKLTVCAECSKHGKTTWELHEKTAFPSQAASATHQGPSTYAPIQIKKKTITARVDTSQELVEDYAEVVRQARESHGFTHEDLGKKINEKESVLRKIELGKMAPNDQLVSKLEHTLKIKLLVPVAEEKVPLPKAASREFTLGDLIKIKEKKSKEQTSKRKPS